MHQPFCQIVPLNRYNWELSLELQLAVEQQHFVPGILYSLAQANFENLFPYGIMREEKMVGFIMYGEFAGICWINRIMIDKDHQRNGIGTQAIRQLLELLRSNINCKEVRTSVAKENTVAIQFFQHLGFRELQQAFEDEVVLVYERRGIPI